MSWGIDPAGAGVGGAAELYFSDVVFEQCLFYRNIAWPEGVMGMADGRGGAVDLAFSSPMFRHCTFHANEARPARGGPGMGGGICCARSSPLLLNCIITNSAYGGAIYCGDTGSHPLLICSDVFGNTDGDWVDCIADQADSSGNISVDPRYCDAGAEDISLRDDSPCLPENNSCGQLMGAMGLGCAVTGVSEQSVAPAMFTLGRCYPNPFNASTTIRYSLAIPAAVTLSIHNILGQKVRTLVDRPVAAGEHTIRWDGRDGEGRGIGSGVYFIVMQAGDERFVRKALVLR